MNNKIFILCVIVLISVFFTSSVFAKTYTHIIDGPIKTSNHYTSIIKDLSKAKKNDTVILEINSPGGRTDIAFTIIVALDKTKAHTKAIIKNAHSAAAYIALHTHEIKMLKYSTLVMHQPQLDFSINANYPPIPIIKLFFKINKELQIFYSMLMNFRQQIFTQEEIVFIMEGGDIFLSGEEVMRRIRAGAV